MSKQQFDREKFRDVVHYVVAQTRSDELGMVKLHKVLYFSDMLWFLDRGSGLTGAEYRKQQFGPCATFLRGALAELEAAGQVRQRREWYYGFEKLTFVSLAASPIARLSESERALLDEVIEFVCRNNTAKSISDFSHNRAWDAARLGQVMPYYTAMNIVPAELADDDLSWAIAEAADVADEESRGAPLQRRGYAAFRESLRSNPR